MIVDSMTADEMEAEFLKDFNYLERKIPYLVKKVRRKAIRTRNKQFKRFFDYISPRKNSWLIQIEFNNNDPLIIPALYYFSHGKMNVMSKHDEKNAFTHYSSHFLHRYNERFLRQEGLSTKEILKIFLPVNGTTVFDYIRQEGTDEVKVFARFKDGVGLGISEARTRYLKTYISSDMIGDWQQFQYQDISRDFDEFWNETNEDCYG